MSFASTASYAQSTASAAQRARPASARHTTSTREAAPTTAAAAPAYPAATSGLASASSLLPRSSIERKSSSYESQSAQQSRVSKLFGKAAVAPDVPYSSTRLAYMTLELLRVTAEEKAALNALQPGKKSYWSTGSGQNHELVFKITSPCLVGFVKLLNKSTSHLDILISMHDVDSQFVKVQSDAQCPHNKTVMYPCGFLPARYLKIKCRRGSPIALYNVSVVGVLERVVWREMGPEMGSMIVEHPEALLLPSKPSLPTREAPSFPSQQVIKADQHQPPLQRCTRE